MLPLSQHHLPDAHRSCLDERVAQERVRLRRALAARSQEVRMVEVCGLDLRTSYEVLDLERLSGGHPRLLEVLVGEDHELTLLDLVALHDVLPGNLTALLFAHALVVDGASVPVVEEPEAQLAPAGHRGIEADRDGHQAEGHRSSPDGARHARRRSKPNASECAPWPRPATRVDCCGDCERTVRGRRDLR